MYDYPRRIKIDDVKKAFPSYTEFSLYRRLKLFADSKTSGLIE